MAMSRAKRFELLLELQRKNEAQAAEALAACVSRLNDERNRIESLEIYYREYQQRFADSRLRLRAKDLMAQRSFLQQISDACSQQRKAVELAEQQLAAGQQTWRAEHLKTENLARYREKLLQQDATLADKKEQRDLDALAIRRSASKI